jgi:hypothetical protein
MAYLETRSSRQTSSQLHHGTADLIANASASALMVYWSNSGATVVAVMCGCHWGFVASASTSCCSCCGCGCLSVTTETFHECWLAGCGVLRAAAHCELDLCS